MSTVWIMFHPYAEHIQKDDTLYGCGCIGRNGKMVLIAADWERKDWPCRFHSNQEMYWDIDAGLNDIRWDTRKRLYHEREITLRYIEEEVIE